MENFKKAKILKKYAKLCVEEGVESERVNLPGRERGEGSNKGKANRKESGSSSDVKDSSISEGKSRRLDSLQKAQQAFRRNKSKQHAERERAEEGDQGERKSQPKQQRRRRQVTSKGQPVMKGQISRMLDTLQQQH